MTIRLATPNDYDPIWTIFHAVIQTGDTYVFHPNTPKSALQKHWFAPYMKTYVIEENHQIVGTYIIKPNQIDLGSHIANCSYMVHPNHHGKGIGKKLCEHSIKIGRETAYKAIQFNIVISTNKAAIHIWKKFGFQIIGTTPKAFKHQNLGYVDAFIMYKDLEQ